MIRIHLTDEQRREIERVSQQAVGRVALRAHGAAGWARLPGAADRPHPRLRGGRGAALAASLSGSGCGRAGGCAAQNQTPVCPSPDGRGARGVAGQPACAGASSCCAWPSCTWALAS
jgi:hypothetical protein